MTSTPELPDSPDPEGTPADAEAHVEHALPVVPDERLLAAHEIARAALGDITPASTVGDPAGYTVEADGVVSLRFANRMPGYPGWFWTVSVAAAGDADPTVLEVELLPGEDALLAPEWVPWAVRLAEYRAGQDQALAEAGDDAAPDADEADADDEEFDDDADDDDADDDDFAIDGSPILHSGDLDGVDIDELDDEAEDDQAEDDQATQADAEHW